ncbi:serine/threonine protein kinase [Desulfobaculum bizertense]|uniref:serine/threonine-protein kinase n=1 Tax=Desulfobaculum bizertense TaxID=376490 RepID=UPI001F357FB1|nr:serine/threonine-protein kinase [Desulfobaculum bizertense]UIJ38978.1 serine/threonine protein kinase [Desulfobaculum bizertense]
MKVIGMLGRGGFGIVEKVKLSSGEVVAKKTLNLTTVPPSQHESIRRRFLREVKYQKTLIHPNIIEIISSDLETNPPYYLMPLAQCSLQKQIIGHNVNSDNLKSMLLDILAGIEFIHSHRKAHRDIKPENILLLENGSYAIADFGLAIDPTNNETTVLTATGVTGGSQHYAAPECYLHFKDACEPADIYSFGAILFDLYSGSPDRIPYSQLTLDGPIGPIIEKCTATKITDRYKSISELRDDLLQAIDGPVFEYLQDKIKSFISQLKINNSFTSSQWMQTLHDLDTINDTTLFHSFFFNLDYDILATVSEQSQETIDYLSNSFARYIYETGFVFEECDHLGALAKILYNYVSIPSKYKIALATLKLGVSHNRWSVEHKFVEMVSPETDSKIIQSLITYAQKLEYPIKDNIEVLLESIDKNSSSIHPLLRK